MNMNTIEYYTKSIQKQSYFLDFVTFLPGFLMGIVCL